MKMDTEEKKLAYLFGYVQALAELHAKEFNRDITAVKNDLLEQVVIKKKTIRTPKKSIEENENSNTLGE